MSSVSRDSRTRYLSENITCTRVFSLQYIFRRKSIATLARNLFIRENRCIIVRREKTPLSNNLREVRFNAICSAVCVVIVVVVVVKVVVIGVVVAIRNGK